MKKNLLTIALIVLALVGLVLFSRFNSGRNANDNIISEVKTGGVLTGQETAFDFGDVSMANGKVSRVFKIKNTGSETLSINKIYTSCMCTEAVLTIADFRSKAFGMLGHGPAPKIKKELMPGQEAEVEVIFDPAAHGPAGLGKITRGVYL